MILFWGAVRERVKTIIDLYEHYECLWNVKSAAYKNVTIKRRAKEDIGKHFGITVMHCFVTGSSSLQNAEQLLPTTQLFLPPCHFSTMSYVTLCSA